MRKERDYHRMHHKRVVQEKNKLITDVKRLDIRPCSSPLLQSVFNLYSNGSDSLVSDLHLLWGCVLDQGAALR